MEIDSKLAKTKLQDIIINYLFFYYLLTVLSNKYNNI